MIAMPVVRRLRRRFDHVLWFLVYSQYFYRCLPSLMCAADPTPNRLLRDDEIVRRNGTLGNRLISN